MNNREEGEMDVNQAAFLLLLLLSHPHGPAPPASRLPSPDFFPVELEVEKKITIIFFV